MNDHTFFRCADILFRQARTMIVADSNARDTAGTQSGAFAQHIAAMALNDLITACQNYEQARRDVGKQDNSPTKPWHASALVAYLRRPTTDFAAGPLHPHDQAADMIERLLGEREPSIRVRRCATCDAWCEYTTSLPGLGQCRARVPAAAPDDGIADWAETNEDDWCRGWQDVAGMTEAQPPPDWQIVRDTMVERGNVMAAEVDRLRAAIRVNALHWAPHLTDDQIDDVIYPPSRQHGRAA